MDNFTNDMDAYLAAQKEKTVAQWLEAAIKMKFPLVKGLTIENETLHIEDSPYPKEEIEAFIKEMQEQVKLLPD